MSRQTDIGCRGDPGDRHVRPPRQDPTCWRQLIDRSRDEGTAEDDDLELRREPRESHDSTPFYERFRAPELSDDEYVPSPVPVSEPFVHGDARHMDRITDGSVALVVTSPPYFAGKEYEEELEREGVPSSYLDYLEMLTDVFAECVRKLEPGGRIAVNVANLGRKPYRSLSADVIRILEHDLGLLLRRAHLAEGRGRQRLRRLGVLPKRRQSCTARQASDRASKGEESSSSVSAPSDAASVA